VLDIEDNKVRRLALYWDRKRTFADLGLSLESDASDLSG